MTTTEYRIYRNLTRPFQTYRPGDTLWFDPTPRHVTLDDTASRTDALNMIFERHNRDDRPDAAYAPSLSVGDVVALDWLEESATFHAVDRFGWSFIDGPMFADVANAEDPIGLGYDAAFDRHAPAAFR